MAGLSYIDFAYGALGHFQTWFAAHYSTEQQRSAHVFVPNRRVARALQFAWAEKQELAPNMMVLGSISHTDCLALFPNQPNARNEILQIPVALSADILRHHMVRFVMQYQERKQTVSSVQRAMALSEDLLALLEKCDEAGIQLDAEKLSALAPSYFARHWRHSSEFLGIIAEYLPLILDEHRAITPIAQQREFMELLARHANEMTAPCVLFGSSGSVPYVRTFMKALVDAPAGHVILPGRVGDEYAQGQANYFTHQAVELMGKTPQPLHASAEQSTNAPQALLCANEEDEARVISTLMREATQRGGEMQTMLVTKDIGLMRRVAAHLVCHNIVADSPSITRMNHTEMGALLVRLTELLANRRDMPLLHALLAHPWVGANDAGYADWREAMDMAAFRGTSSYKPVEFFDGSDTGTALDHWVRHSLPSVPQNTSLDGWCEQLAHFIAIAGLGDAQQQAANEWLETLIALSPLYGEMHVRDMAALVAAQLQAQSQAGQQPTHPNLRMLTPVEARLMHADRVILGAFHEGVWGNGNGNAWLNDAQLRELGLPTRAITQSLTRHDIAMHVGAPEVFFTRAAMVNHSPTIPYAASHQYVNDWQSHSHWHGWAHAQQQAEYAPIAAAAPSPAKNKRPTQLPVRALETAQQNPYQLYVDHVLGLQRLDDYGAKPEAMMFGILAHRVMELLANGQHWGAPLRDRLLQQHDCSAAEFPFWQARLDSIAAFAKGWLAQHKAQATALHTEYKIEQQFQVSENRTMQLKGRIDAWFACEQGAMLVDYKTGQIPKAPMIERGESCQLTAYGMMLQQADGQWPASIHYLRLPDVKKGADATEMQWGAEEWHTQQQGLLQLMANIQHEESVFIARPHGLKASDANTYDGIARVLELQANAG